MKYAFYSRSFHERILKAPEFAVSVMDGEVKADEFPWPWKMFMVKIGDSFISATHIEWERYPYPTSDAVYVGEIGHIRDIEAVDPSSVFLITVPMEIPVDDKGCLE